jgi:hypothetical protein
MNAKTSCYSHFLRVMRTCSYVLIAAIVLCCSTCVDAKDVKAAADAKPTMPVPKGFKLLYSQNFDHADALKGFQFTDAKAWRFSDKGNGAGSGAMELFGRSKYKTKVRSPFNLGMISGKKFGSFVLEVDLQQTGREYGHRDMCLFFGFTDVAKFYYTHIASTPDPHAHNVFLVNEKPRVAIAKIPKKGIKWGGEVWQKVRLERDAGKGDIKLFWNGNLIHHTNDKHFQAGHIGFGSFDDTGKVDNIRIWGKNVEDGGRQLFPKK